MASLVDYPLSELKNLCIREFGLDSTDSEVVSMVEDQINKAQQWVAQKRESRFWLQKPLVLTVKAPLTGLTGDFTNGSTSVVNVSSLTGIAAGDVLSGSGDDPETQGYIITAASGTTITLDAPYIGTTETGKILSIYFPYIQLPDDYSRLWSLRNVSSLKNNLSYIVPNEYDQKRWSLRGLNLKQYYTITQSPISESDAASPKYFIALLPFPTEATLLRGIYYKDIPDLVNDTDITPLPRKHRLVILYIAQWFVAVHMKKEQDTVDHYKELALGTLLEFGAHYETASTLEREDRSESNILDDVLGDDSDDFLGRLDLPLG